MIFVDAGLPGAFLVDQERHVDDRGYFSRTYCADEFRRAGLDPTIAQCSTSWNERAFTLRGLHLQLEPHGEAKLVRCTAGAIFDVVVDLRPDEPTFGRWVGHEIDAREGRGVYVPRGMAHGFLTLEARCEVLYQISVAQEASAASGIRWDDPDLAIAWPSPPSVMSERDGALPSLAEFVRAREGPRVTHDGGDDREAFEQTKRTSAAEMHSDAGLVERALGVSVDADRYSWSYQWSWLGLPIIQMPPDIIATQEIIWTTRPQLIIETGVARGGWVILSSSILQLIGDGRVLAIDIEIRPHNRVAIESHPMSHRIELIEGSSIDPAVVAQAVSAASGLERVMVILDSNHTHEHVLAELEAYAPLVTVGQYLIVADTAIEHIPVQVHRPRPWGPGDNPMTALDEYRTTHPELEPDPYVNAKLLLTSSPGGYLRRAR